MGKIPGILACALLLLTPLACKKEQNAPSPASTQNRGMGGQQAMGNAREVVVEEVIPAGRYTYLKVREGSETLWLAATAGAYKKGETLRFNRWLQMTSFQSKTLKRTFDTILFIQGFLGRQAQPGGMDSPMRGMPPHGGMGPMGGHSSGMTMPPMGKKAGKKKLEISVKPAEGGVTIGQLLAKRKDYAGKKVLIRGQVTKFSPLILGKNWVHLQDGTGTEKEFDLVVTTMDTVKVGDVVTFEGKVSLDKDLGSGYKFAVLVEEANRVEKR